MSFGRLLPKLADLGSRVKIVKTVFFGQILDVEKHLNSIFLANPRIDFHEKRT